jgi:two-component system, LuxR family, sensor kinase FixL
LAKTFAHQLNPPLTAIANYLDGAQEILAQANPDLGSLREAVDEAATLTFRAGELVQRLNDAVWRSEIGPTVASLPTLIDEASGLALINGGDQGLKVHVSLDRAAEKVVADRIQIQQVLLNLIRNAIEAMENSSTKELEITSRREPGGYIRLTVADSGPGIGEEVRARLFQPFASTKDDALGLGLSICRSIVEAHGGRIWTEPSSTGRTAFHSTLKDAGLGGHPEL